MIRVTRGAPMAPILCAVPLTALLVTRSGRRDVLNLETLTALPLMRTSPRLIPLVIPISRGNVRDETPLTVVIAACMVETLPFIHGMIDVIRYSGEEARPQVPSMRLENVAARPLSPDALVLETARRKFRVSDIVRRSLPPMRSVDYMNVLVKMVRVVITISMLTRTP